jgi:hypothetical protein
VLYILATYSAPTIHFMTLSTVVHLQSVLLVQTLLAGTDVAAGEELTISYLDLATAGRQERQARLQRSFRFECRCEVIKL